MSAMLREAGLLKQLKDMAETHARELRAYEATVENLEQRVRELEAERVPEGYVVVPIEPTQEMLNASGTYDDDARIYWNKFLAAAQQPKKEGE